MVELLLFPETGRLADRNVILGAVVSIPSGANFYSLFLSTNFDEFVQNFLNIFSTVFKVHLEFFLKFP